MMLWAFAAGPAGKAWPGLPFAAFARTRLPRLPRVVLSWKVRGARTGRGKAMIGPFQSVAMLALVASTAMEGVGRDAGA